MCKFEVRCQQYGYMTENYWLCSGCIRLRGISDPTYSSRSLLCKTMPSSRLAKFTVNGRHRLTLASSLIVDGDDSYRSAQKYLKKRATKIDNGSETMKPFFYSIANRPASMTQVRMSTSISSTRSAEFPIHQTEKQSRNVPPNHECSFILQQSPSIVAELIAWQRRRGCYSPS